MMAGGRSSSTLGKVGRGLAVFLGALIGVVILLVIIVLVAPDILRSPLAHILSAKLDRPAHIDGDIKVRLSPLSVQLDKVSIDNVAGAPEPHLVEVDRLAFTVDGAALLHGHLLLREVALTHPLLWPERRKDGSVNWNLGRPGPKTQQPALPIQFLRIDDGIIHYRDELIETSADIQLSSKASAAPRTVIEIQGKGSTHDQPLSLDGEISAPPQGSDRGQPYTVSFRLSARDGSLSFKGGIVPFKLDRFEADVSAAGRDLSDLHPALPVPIPWTPPYQLEGHLVRNVNVWTLRDLKGRMGQSDIRGQFEMDLATGTGKRPSVRADLVSHSLRISDLGGFVGLPPNKQSAAAKPPDQRQAEQARQASDKALPQKPMNLASLHSIDADVRYTGEHLQATTSLPLDNLHATLHLHNGVLQLQPLAFGLASGQVEMDIDMDTRASPVRSRAEIRVRNVEVERLLPAAKAPQAVSVGRLGGAAHADATGTSVAEMLGSINGNLGLIMWGGQASTIALLATNLDLAGVAGLIASGDKKAEVRCAIGSFEARDGVMTPQQAVIDTSAVKIRITGDVNFKTEQWNLHLDPAEKHASPLALHGPINVTGTFKHPSILPGVENIALRAGAAVALGVVNPLLALLPLIDFGSGKDADCRALAQSAEAAATKPPPPAKAGAKAPAP